MLFFLIFRTFLIRSSIRSSIPSKDSEGEKLSRNSRPVSYTHLTLPTNSLV